mgnify:CR=1 FL=1
MSVFRVERNRNYTVMSNYHLRDRRLSLKAKGLLSQMLSLPEDWDYTLGGLAQINREKIDAIRAAVRELEAAGYVVRSRERDAKGRLRGADYVIYEQPQTQSPVPDSPMLENPMLENPTLDFPTSENPMQLNKDKQNKKLQNTDSLPFRVSQEETGPACQLTEPDTDSASTAPADVCDQIELDKLCRQDPDDAPLYQEIAGLLADTLSSRRKTIRVSGMDLPRGTVCRRLRQLTSEHIRFVVEGLKQNHTQVRNPKQYILAALFNAPVSMYAKTVLDVGHDLSSGFQPPERC